MKIFKKAIAAMTALFTVAGSLCLPVSVAAADPAIVVSSGRAVVGNGTPGIAIVASYGADGKLTKVVKQPVKEGCVAKLDVKTGDKVMYWGGDGITKPLAKAVTVTDSTSDANEQSAYEKAVQSALCEALGKNKGKNMTELQKAVALHDWLVINCRYDETTRRKYAHKEYGAIVEGYAVCDGYAKAYNDLLGRVGVKATLVLGMKPINIGDTPQPHAWSCVTINGIKYHVDVTSDDPVPDRPETVSRSCFLVSDTKLNKYGHADYSTHCTDKTYENYDIFTGFSMQFIWDDDIQKFYYIDMDKVKTTSDFTEKITRSSDDIGPNSTSYFFTNDGKYVCFFRPLYGATSHSAVYLYSFETGEYYTYTVEGIKDVVVCRVRQKGNNVEVVRDRYQNGMQLVSVKATLPLPPSSKKRTVTFDPNYSGAKPASCEYLNSYWKNGIGSFDEPQRGKLAFGGWYTQKDGGTKVENFEEIPGDNITLYAYWWREWKISQDPTLTESGKAKRELEGYPSVTEEITIPNLTDTSVWTKTFTKEPEAGKDGYERYKSEYGTVQITLPMKDYEYSITYSGKDNLVYITVPGSDAEKTLYKIKYEWGAGTSKIKTITTTVAGQYPVPFTGNPKPSGKVKVTLCDIDENPICSVEYVAN